MPPSNPQLNSNDAIRYHEACPRLDQPHGYFVTEKTAAIQLLEPWRFTGSVRHRFTKPPLVRFGKFRPVLLVAISVLPGCFVSVLAEAAQPLAGLYSHLVAHQTVGAWIKLHDQIPGFPRRSPGSELLRLQSLSPGWRPAVGNHVVDVCTLVRDSQPGKRTPRRRGSW